MNQPKEKKQWDNDIVSVTGKAMYARVFDTHTFMRKDGTPDTPIWTLDVLLDARSKAIASEKGVKLKNGNVKYDALIDENGLRDKGYDGTFITVKKKTLRKQFDQEAGKVVKDSFGLDVYEAAPRPAVRDSQGNDIPEEANLKIGNLSDVKVVFGLTKPEFGGPGSYGCRLISTQILNLVEYKATGSGTFVYGAKGETPHTPTLVANEKTDDFNADEIPF